MSLENPEDLAVEGGEFGEESPANVESGKDLEGYNLGELVAFFLEMVLLLLLDMVEGKEEVFMVWVCRVVE